MNDYTVLICDDKEAVHESLTRFLNDEDIRVISVYDGEAVLSEWKQHDIDLMILDIMLPNMNAAREKDFIPIRQSTAARCRYAAANDLALSRIICQSGQDGSAVC